MPNWTYNQLTVEGEQDELDRFTDLIKYTDDDGEEVISILRTLVPCPAELEDTTKGWLGSDDSEAQHNLEEQQQRNIEKYGHPTWYEWNHENWGCKWSDNNTQLTVDRFGALDITFETPWSPPVAGFITISKLFPSLRFVLSFTEEGNFFVGAVGFLAGETVEVKGNVNVGDHFFEEGKYDAGYEALNNERDKCAKLAHATLVRVTN
jgi:hypothetical protein